MSLTSVTIRWSQFRHNWSRFWTILHTVNRSAELLRLIAWAKRKKLRGPYNCYKRRLAEEEIRLHRYALRSPRLVRSARLVHHFSNLISTVPKYPPKGSAAGYRLQ